MKTHILRGTKEEIAQQVVRIEGDVQKAIVIVAEPSEYTPPAPDEDIFAEMEPYMVDAGDVDYSREAIYSRMEGE